MSSRYADNPPEEYAAFWGCDGSFDRLPNQSGDGALFYNFNVVADWPIDQRIEFYENFLPAIERTVQSVQQSPAHHSDEDATAEENVADLFALHDEVRARLGAARREAGIEPNDFDPYPECGGLIDRYMGSITLPDGWVFVIAGFDDATFRREDDGATIAIPVAQAESEIVARIEDFERRTEAVAD